MLREVVTSYQNHWWFSRLPDREFPTAIYVLVRSGFITVSLLALLLLFLSYSLQGIQLPEFLLE